MLDSGNPPPGWAALEREARRNCGSLVAVTLILAVLVIAAIALPLVL